LVVHEGHGPVGIQVGQYAVPLLASLMPEGDQKQVEVIGVDVSLPFTGRRAEVKG
jgi:hypothetical protein